MAKKGTWASNLAQVWDKILPPARPSISELKIFEKYIKKLAKNKNAKILILGATPELRDLVLKHKLVPICADINKENFIALKKLMKHKGKEIFIHSDWLKLKGKEIYDLIIGDTSLTMLPWKKWEDYLKRFKQIIKKDGMIVHRSDVRFSEDEKRTPLEIFQLYRKSKKKAPIFSSILISLCITFHRKDKEYCNLNELIKKVKGLYKKGLISKKECRGITDFLVAKGLKVIIPRKKEFEKMARKYFRIVKIERGKNPLSKYLPIHILKPKK